VVPGGDLMSEDPKLAAWLRALKKLQKRINMHIKEGNRTEFKDDMLELIKLVERAKEHCSE
jgi:hypothetical protein